MPESLQLTDEELCILISKDNRTAFHAIYNRYKMAMLMYASKKVALEIAEDLVHDVFIKVWDHRNKIVIEERFAGYLFKSLRHKIIDYMSKDKNSQKYLEGLSDIAVNFSYNKSDEKLRQDLFMASILVLLQNFNEQSLVIFKLRIEGFNNHEIAEKLGLSEKTVRNQYSILLKYLREKLPFLIILLLRF